MLISTFTTILTPNSYTVRLTFSQMGNITELLLLLGLMFLHFFWTETLLAFVLDYLFKDAYKANDINI